MVIKELFILFFIGLACFLLSSCTTVDLKEGNYACVYNVDMPGKTEQCSGSMDIYYHYKNGKPPKNKQYKNTYYNPNLPDFFVKQEYKKECYAASLASAFNYYGFSYKKEQFSNAVTNYCNQPTNMSATFSQIIFAATDVHYKDEGVFYVETPNRSFFEYIGQLLRPILQYHYQRNGSIIYSNMVDDVYVKDGMCQTATGNHKTFYRGSLPVLPIIRPQNILPGLSANNVWSYGQAQKPGFLLDFSQPQSTYSPNTQLNLYRPVTWSRIGKTETVGGLIPIRHPGDLIYHFAKGTPVIVGLNFDGTGHTVLITKIKYSYDSHLESKLKNINNLRNYENVWVHWVEVMDSASDNYLYKISGDDFFSGSKFMVAHYEIYQ